MAYLILVSLLFTLTAEAKQPRSYQAIKQFKLDNPCPANGRYKGSCPGWIIDHKIALKRGGADIPSNMQWMTVKDAKAKDKWE